MNRRAALSLAYISIATLSLFKSPISQASNRSNDFSFCVVATHGRCFTLKNDQLKSDHGELKLSTAQLKKVTTEVQNFIEKTTYALPYKNSGAENCQIGLRYRTEVSTIERCAEKLTSSDTARMQNLFQLLSTGAS